ncbi:hypothetical protein TNCV_2193851 [Trichonephila clavipes]|uniref:Uncharacterized protein n=1 Tax=Trichonephila clavipes TaxID=2585209 RepID=A0A8X6VFC4_TRICX|nr:hypothetical protein TNCV_2193851 [Trichonephila clavipes]
MKSSGIFYDFSWNTVLTLEFRRIFTQEKILQLRNKSGSGLHLLDDDYSADKTYEPLTFEGKSFSNQNDEETHGNLCNISAMRFVFACLFVLALMSVAIEAVPASNNQQGNQQQSNQQQKQQKNNQGAQNAKNGQGDQNGP